jgi:hypothetical protein
MDNKQFIKDLLTQKLDEVIGGPKSVADGQLDSYYAMQAAKAKAKKDGKVWDKLGQDEKDRYVAPEMEKAGYEKKDGNTKWTRVPDKKDDEPKKDKPDLSTPEKRIKHFSDNPTASMAGTDVSDDEAKQIQLARMEKQLESLFDKAQKAQEKMYDAEESGDDDAYETADEENEYWEEKIRSLENKIEDLKDEIDSKREETIKSFKNFIIK